MRLYARESYIAARVVPEPAHGLCRTRISYLTFTPCINRIGSPSFAAKPNNEWPYWFLNR